LCVCKCVCERTDTPVDTCPAPAPPPQTLAQPFARLRHAPTCPPAMPSPLSPRAHAARTRHATSPPGSQAAPASGPRKRPPQAAPASGPRKRPPQAAPASGPLQHWGAWPRSASHGAVWGPVCPCGPHLLHTARGGRGHGKGLAGLGSRLLVAPASVPRCFMRALKRCFKRGASAPRVRLYGRRRRASSAASRSCMAYGPLWRIAPPCLGSGCTLDYWRRRCPPWPTRPRIHAPPAGPPHAATSPPAPGSPRWSRLLTGQVPRTSQGRARAGGRTYRDGHDGLAGLHRAVLLDMHPRDHAFALPPRFM
jgi:hypothetical protein